MALITCPECGKSFSDRAAHCPQCGIPTSEALKAIAGIPTDTPAQPAPQQSAPQQPVAPAQPTQNYAPAFAPQPKPKKQRSLLIYILVVAVVCIGILILMISLATSGAIDEIDPSDTTRVSQLEPDTMALENEENDTTGLAARQELQRLREQLARQNAAAQAQNSAEPEPVEDNLEGPSEQGPLQAAPVAPAAEPAAPAQAPAQAPAE